LAWEPVVELQFAHRETADDAAVGVLAVCPMGCLLRAEHRGGMNRSGGHEALAPDGRLGEAHPLAGASGRMLRSDRLADATLPCPQGVRELGTDELARPPVQRPSILPDDRQHHHSDPPATSTSETEASSR